MEADSARTQSDDVQPAALASPLRVRPGTVWSFSRGRRRRGGGGLRCRGRRGRRGRGGRRRGRRGGRAVVVVVVRAAGVVVDGGGGGGITVTVVLLFGPVTVTVCESRGCRFGSAGC